MPMKKPCHPGELLKEECLIPLNLTVTEAAKFLGVSRYTLSCIVNEKQGITPIMALKLSKAFNTTPEVWLNMQMNYDLAIAREKTDLSNIPILNESA